MNNKLSRTLFTVSIIGIVVWLSDLTGPTTAGFSLAVGAVACALSFITCVLGRAEAETAAIK